MFIVKRWEAKYSRFITLFFFRLFPYRRSQTQRTKEHSERKKKESVAADENTQREKLAQRFAAYLRSLESGIQRYSRGQDRTFSSRASGEFHGEFQDTITAWL